MCKLYNKIALVTMLLLLMGVAGQAMSQTVMVTFRVNTSTNLDTLGENGAVQIRGALLAGDGTSTRDGDLLPGGGNISWSSASSLVFSNVGGDYWEGTFELNSDDTLTYKYWTDLGGLDGPGTFPDGGWEGAFNVSQGLARDTRILIVGNSDTTLDMQYYQPGAGTAAKDEFTAPFETKADSVAIYFRVNMAGQTEAGSFDPAVNGPVGIRGDDAVSGGKINWGTTLIKLSREENSMDNGSFWSGVGYIPKNSIAVGSTQNYKFFVENSGTVDWEGNIDNRTFVYTSSLVTRMDTTLQWVHFDNVKATGNVPLASQVTFRVSTEALEGMGLFDRGVGDDIKVIGAKGWGRPDDYIDLAFIPALQEWATTEPFNVIPGTEINYKYFVVWDSSRVDSTSPNFIKGLSLDNGWEEPSAAGGGNRKWVYEDTPTQAPGGDFGFDRQFYASVPQNGWFPNDVAVTFSVNMAAAMDAAQNANPLFDPATDEVHIQMDGSLLALQQGFGVGGEDARVLQLTDGDGDMIYTGTWDITGPGWYQLGYVIAYGNATDGFVTNGGGFESGRRYYQFVQPTNVNADLSTEWPTAVDLATVDWKESDLPIEPPPDLTQPTSVADNGSSIPDAFALAQNYPNPFNPETRIEYNIPSEATVKIEVYNIVGQVVNTLVNKKQQAGSYSVTWQGDNQNGQLVSSGVYFLKMKTNTFNKVRKMTLLR